MSLSPHPSASAKSVTSQLSGRPFSRPVCPLGRPNGALKLVPTLSAKLIANGSIWPSALALANNAQLNQKNAPVPAKQTNRASAKTGCE